MRIFSCLKNVSKRLRLRRVSLLALVSGGSDISELARINRFVRVYSSSVGAYTYVGSGSRLTFVDIGKFCSVSWDCTIGLASHPLSFVSTSPIFYERDNGVGISWLEESRAVEGVARTRLGNDVWLGAGATIMAGVQVGNGAVVAAGAVVTKNVEPYTIVGGVPAKVIGRRFSEETSKALMAAAWWDWPVDTIRARVADFTNGKILSEIKSKGF